MVLVLSGNYWDNLSKNNKKNCRWVCTSGDPKDLETTDKLAFEVLSSIVAKGVPKEIEQQYNDNIKWITEASKHKMVVGSQVKMFKYQSLFYRY